MLLCRPNHIYILKSVYVELTVKRLIRLLVILELVAIAIASKACQSFSYTVMNHTLVAILQKLATAGHYSYVYTKPK